MMETIAALRARVATLEAELETERMRLDACGVVANANTASSAGEQRKMHPDYWSASCGDVVKAVDREMALRARVAKLEVALEPFARNVNATSLREALGHIERKHLLDARAALKDAP